MEKNGKKRVAKMAKKGETCQNIQNNGWKSAING